jgi:hypothetical protein
VVCRVNPYRQLNSFRAESKQGLKSERFPPRLVSMAKDFEKEESPAFITERSSGQHPLTEYSFYRLVFKLLREEKPKEESRSAS